MTNFKMSDNDLQELARCLDFQKAWIEEDMVDEPDDEPFIEVRLQLFGDGWTLRTGDSSYDQDHRGYWGSGFLTRDTDCDELAADLYGQAMDHKAQCHVEEE